MASIYIPNQGGGFHMRLLQIGHPSAIRYMKQAEEQGIGRGVSEAEQCHVLKRFLPISTNPEFRRIVGCSHCNVSHEIPILSYPLLRAD